MCRFKKINFCSRFLRLSMLPWCRERPEIVMCWLEWLEKLKCRTTGLDVSLSFLSTSRKCSRKQFPSLLPTQGGGNSTTFYTRRLPPDVQPLTLFYTIFDRKGTPFVYLPLKNGAPFTYLLEHYIPFSKPLECSKRTILGENSITRRDVNQKQYYYILIYFN